MECQIVNLEAGMPTVDMARTHLNMTLRSAKANRVKVLKLIHGYGSSGKGGAIRQRKRRVGVGKSSPVVAARLWRAKFVHR